MWKFSDETCFIIIKVLMAVNIKAIQSSVLWHCVVWYMELPWKQRPGSSKILALIYQTIWRYIQEDHMLKHFLRQKRQPAVFSFMFCEITALLPPSLDNVIYSWVCKCRVIQFIVAPLSVTVNVNKNIFVEFSLVFTSYTSCFYHHLEKNEICYKNK
jgi:hypothetical protein